MPNKTPTPQDIEEMELKFAQTFFDEISKVVTTNEQEMLCMLLPGITLTKSDYEYDVENDVKSTVVEANESKLANKLFNPYSLVASDNGTTLPTQYMTALNLLTPKLNAFIAKSKNKLRELLMKHYPFTFENADGTTEYREDCTFQEVYFYLYTDYLNAAKDWADEQAEEKIKKTDTSEYLKWYQSVADVRFNIINQKRAKILALFSPNDMKIIEGVLDSGSGAELQEARQLLNNLRKFNPDGSYTYPVKFYPADWFKYLDTSFTPVDLLSAPDKIADKLGMLYTRRDTIIQKIQDLSSITPSLKEVATAAKAAKDANDACDTAFNKAVSTTESAFYDFAKNIVKSICFACTVTSVARDSMCKYISALGDAALATLITETLCTEMKSGVNKLQNALDEFNKKTTECIASWANYIDLANKSQLKDSISMLRTQLIDVNNQIESLSSNLCLAISRNSSAEGVEPPSTPKGFSQVVISHTNNYASLETNYDYSVTKENTSAGVCIFKYNSSSVNTDSSFSELSTSDGTTIDIGMNVAKVAIERQWFNPGVFRLTKNMYNLAEDKVKISLGTNGFMKNNQLKMSECVLPCFPTAMLVARDVTIKISKAVGYDSQELSTSYSKSTKTHSYVFYNSSKTTETMTQDNLSTSYFDGKTITMKFAEPQVIGYYLQAIANDQSTAYSDSSTVEDSADYMTITKFVETYKTLIDTCITANKK